jgi:hypothetical protein
MMQGHKMVDCDRTLLNILVLRFDSSDCDQVNEEKITDYDLANTDTCVQVSWEVLVMVSSHLSHSDVWPQPPDQNPSWDTSGRKKVTVGCSRSRSGRCSHMSSHVRVPYTFISSDRCGGHRLERPMTPDSHRMSSWSGLEVKCTILSKFRVGSWSEKNSIALFLPLIPEARNLRVFWNQW